MPELNVVQYWEGPCPPVYALMMKTVEAAYPDVQVFSRERAQDYFDSFDIPIDLSTLTPNHQSDVFRFFYLYRSGGLYLDADTVLFRPLSVIPPLIENFDGVYHQYGPRTAWPAPAVLASRKGTLLFEKITERILTVYRDHAESAQWGTYGPICLKRSVDENLLRTPVALLVGGCLSPISWKRSHRSRTFAKPTPSPFSFPSRCYGQVFTSFILKEFKHLSEEQILGGNWMLGDFIKKGLYQ